MKFNLQHTLFLFTIYGAHALCANDAEIVLRGYSSKAISLAKNAEKELSKGTDESLTNGIKLYEEVIVDPSFKRLGTDQQLPIYRTLGAAYQKKELYAQEEELLKKLIESTSFKSYRITLKSDLVTSYIQQERLEEAEAIIKKLCKKPKALAQQERKEVSLLLERLSLHYEKHLRLGEKLMQAGEYKDACPHLETTLKAIRRKKFPLQSAPKARGELLAKLKLQLALAYSFSADFAKVSSLFHDEENYWEPSSEPIAKMHQQGSLLGALALLKDGHYEDAYTFFSSALQPPSYLSLPHLQIGYLEKCHAAFNIGKMKSAEHALLAFFALDPSSELRHKGLSFKARLHLYNNRFSEAVQVIDELLVDTMFCREHTFEANYLKGYLLYKTQKYEDAYAFFERSIPEQERAQLPWTSHTLTLLGNCYLYHAQKCTQEFEKKAFLEKSTLCFEELLQRDVSEQAALHYAKGLFFTSILLNHPPTLEKLQAHVKKYEFLLSDDGKFEVDFLLSLATNSLPNTLQENTSSLYGIALLLQAMKQVDTKARNSLHSIEKAYKYVKDRNLEPMIVELLLRKPQDKNSLLFAKQIIDDKLAKTKDQKTQIVLLAKQIRIDLQLALLQKKFDTDIEQKAFGFLQEHPDPSVMHALGFFYLKNNVMHEALTLFQKAAHDFPEYYGRDQLLYISQHLLEKTESQIDAIRALKKELFTSYPTSSYAAECYFSFISEKEYALGTPHAISHLKNMPTLFANSPYTCLAHFYIANFYKTESSRQKDPQTQLEQLVDAKNHYQKLLTLSSQVSSSHVLCKNIEDILRPTLLSCSQVLLELSELGPNKIALLNECEGCLKALITKLDPQKPTDFPMWLDSMTSLASTYEKLEKSQDCRKQLKSVLHYLHVLNIRGKPLAKVYIALARADVKAGEIIKALRLLTIAERVLQKEPSRELLLEIWIEKSMCFRRQENLEKAMVLLSKVINDKEASQLRIKAMLLRSEIYELTHRKELAIRQLEAAAKKGGIWGSIAKKKLAWFKGEVAEK